MGRRARLLNARDLEELAEVARTAAPSQPTRQLVRLRRTTDGTLRDPGGGPGSASASDAAVSRTADDTSRFPTFRMRCERSSQPYAHRGEDAENEGEP
ncbi:hypothetical protein DEJ16_09905 [Curtobacterium sp. MCJR17_055]|nr:hypothetical protein DEI87_15150 [Curtobacterium sp. MCBD17_029]PYY54654.1 hypothetical protein DEJ16_09905 [Curtobacterium sp. MCJR17_055]PYY60889.1 hypothetical protein DEJ26_03055 [Curtobacterium sp. MCPF17_015]